MQAAFHKMPIQAPRTERAVISRTTAAAVSTPGTKRETIHSVPKLEINTIRKAFNIPRLPLPEVAEQTEELTTTQKLPGDWYALANTSQCHAPRLQEAEAAQPEVKRSRAKIARQATAPSTDGEEGEQGTSYPLEKDLEGIRQTWEADQRASSYPAEKDQEAISQTTPQPSTSYPTDNVYVCRPPYPLGSNLNELYQRGYQAGRKLMENTMEELLGKIKKEKAAAAMATTMYGGEMKKSSVDNRKTRYLPKHHPTVTGNAYQIVHTANNECIMILSEPFLPDDLNVLIERYSHPLMPIWLMLNCEKITMRHFEWRHHPVASLKNQTAAEYKVSENVRYQLKVIAVQKKMDSSFMKINYTTKWQSKEYDGRETPLITGLNENLYEMLNKHQRLRLRESYMVIEIKKMKDATP
jgi:hypothetical protein